jgi:uncharacterized protein
MSTFECNRCGACCRVIGRVPELAHLDRGDGACEHLVETDEGHGCQIYESRPLLCRVDETKPAVLSQAEWNRRNTEACGLLRLEVYGGN